MHFYGETGSLKGLGETLTIKSTEVSERSRLQHWYARVVLDVRLHGVILKCI